MYCKYCGKEISEKAKYCDGCGCPVDDEPREAKREVKKSFQSKKKKKKHPILVTFLIILSIMIIVGSIGSSEDAPQKISSQSPTEKTPTETVVEKTYTIGDTLEMNGVVVTLNDVYETSGSQYLTPTEGNIFVVCEFTIENNTNSDIAVSSMMSFNAYFDDYSASLSLGAITSENGKQQLDGTVVPGKKISGIVGYEVASDWSELEIRFSPNAFSSKDFIFVCNK